MLLHIELPYTIDALHTEIEQLVGKLPSGSRAVMHTDRTVSIFIPPAGLPAMLAAKLKISMSNFSNWWLLPISDQIVCKNGSMDPLQHRMNEFLGVSGRKAFKTQNVPLTERRQPRGKPAV